MPRGYKTKKGIDGSLHEERVKVIIIDDLKREIRKHGRVCIERLGCFELVDVKARRFKNNNGKMSLVPPYKKVAFRSSLPFKKFINER